MGEVTMFYRTIFLCFVGFILVKLVKTEPPNFPEITFTIESRQDKDNVPHLICDHDDTSNKYTVLEEEEFKIITKHNSHINYLNCRDYTDNQKKYNYMPPSYKNVTTFIAKKNMGTLWNCTVLSNRDGTVVHPVVLYDGHTYSAAYCYMQIHVRQTKPPQTILVNNMALPAVRTDLSVKDVDFTAEYQYANDDVVKVTCINFLGTSRLTMEYPMADTLSDKFNSTNLSSSQAISFFTKLHSEHNNSYMICTDTETNDYTKFMVRFVMRTEFSNIISIKINGMTLRPKLNHKENNQYGIEYKYMSNLLMKVVCEVERPDVKLVVMGFVGEVKGYNKKELPEQSEKQREMSFHLNEETKTLACGADYYIGGASAELVYINFSRGNFPFEHPLHMELPPNGTVMELYAYSEDKSRHFMFYEFEDDETLQLKCGPLHYPQPGPVLYIQFKNSICKSNGCFVTQNLTVTDQHDNPETVCRIMEPKYPLKPIPGNEDRALKEISVIFRKKVLTTTSTTTTTTTTTTVQPTDLTPVPDSSDTSLLGEKGNDLGTMAVIVGVVVCIIIICVFIVFVKLRKRNHSQGDPHNRNYENLATPSETSMPAFPPQWESNYAVPVDRRTDDTTYSVPCNEPVLYSTPIPKNLRNKKQKPVEPTYAVLEVPNAKGRKNVFKETDDPNYAEVYANRQEQCYGKVLPKSMRNKMDQDSNPYSYVTNEPSYVNTAGEPEPMYCEPANAAAGQYANLNSSHYANSNAQEYVEPTYCEPQKPRK